jgi:hypothetical protein
MLSRMEFAVTRHGMLGSKIVALLRSTMACCPYPPEGLENGYWGADLAMVSGLERPAQHIGSRRRRLSVLLGPIFPDRPNS